MTAQSPHIVLCIILAVPGLIGWILSYFLYKKTVGKETERMTLLIEEKYDEIYEICEKGNKLLYLAGRDRQIWKIAAMNPLVTAEVYDINHFGDLLLTTAIFYVRIITSL